MHRQQGISSFHATAKSLVPRLDGHYQAQVIGRVPKEHAVNVLLPGLSAIDHSADRGGLKVSVLARRAGGYIGEVDLPRVGDWGVVVFLQGSHQYPVWLGSLYPTYAGLATGVPDERIDHHDSGVYFRIDPEGNLELSHPSGCYVRIGEGTALASRTRRRRKANTATAETVPYDIPEKPIPTVHLDHPAGTTVTISPDGGVVLVTPGATLTIDANGAVSLENVGLVDVQAGTNMTMEATLSALFAGAVATQVGGIGAVDEVALRAAIETLRTTYNSHTHNGSQVPDQQLSAWTPGTHHTINTKAI